MNATVTFFSDYAAATKREQALDLTELAELIENTTRPDKSRLPWLKLARFGDLRTEKNSLRWDGNLLAVTGIEADYDGEEMSFEEARDRLAGAGLLAVLYTSPSHTEEEPRWRVLCPSSQEYPPDQRDHFLARLNGLFGGIFSRESWTRSQGYYFGSVDANPSHRVALLDGLPIDEADELDATAIGRPEKPKPTAGNGADGSNGHADPAAITAPAVTDKRVNGKIESLLDNIRAARKPNKRGALIDNGIALAGYLHLAGWTQEEAVEKLVGALADEVEDWEAARKTAAWAVSEGVKRPCTMDDRPEYASRRRTAPPPRPAPEPQPEGEETHFPTPPPEAEDCSPREWDQDTGPDGETAEAADEAGEAEAEAEAGVDPAALPDLFVMKSDLPLVSQRLRDRLARHEWLFERAGPARLTCYPPDEKRPAEIHQLGIEGAIHAAHEVCRPYQVDYRGTRSNVTLPDRVARLYLALNGRWNLRMLNGICASVLLEDDGAIHSHEGYHAPSGMWCNRPPPLSVPDRPFKDEAVDALNRLRAAMRTFTFKGSPLTRIGGIDADVVDIEQPPGLCESAALCGLLTAVCRPSLILAPGVLINAPAMSGSGAGKGLLARFMIAVGLGVIVEATAAGHDDAEFEKRVATALIAGDPALLLDNLNNTLLRSGQLESCLTEPVVGVRIFGHLKKQKVLARIFVVLTGNGLQISGDGARRYVYPELDPPTDNPSERNYPPGFLDDIIARRGELLSDCLTIWRYGRQQSNLKRGLPFGSYERWATWVRDPLLALGCDDPVKGVKQARERDAARVNVAALFTVWREWHRDNWVKADDLNWHVRRLIDDRERVPAIRQRLAQLAGTRLGGFRLEGKIEGNAANAVWFYRVIEIENG